MSTSALATQDTKVAAKKTFQQLVDGDQFKSQLALALPKHLTTERFIRVLMTATLKNPQLLECTQESLFKGIFDCAAIGLELDGRRAHLVPLRNKKKQGQPLEANLWLDYKGVAELVMRSGVVSNIHADIVCENDVFEYDRGELKKHTIDFRKDRGDMYAAYCIIRMKDGGEKCEVMSIPQINRVRNASPGKDATPWTEHYDEMAKKTVFKRASKWVPLSSEVKNVLENENDDEPLNVTPKKSLGALIGSEDLSTTATPRIDAPGAQGASESQPEAKQEYTAEQRQALLKEVEGLMLDNGITEAKVMIYVHQQKLAKEGQDEVGTLETSVLDAIRAVIPTLKK